MTTNSYTLDIPAFRIEYPAFADEDKYPDDILEINFATAGCYVTNANAGWLNGDCRYKALTLMTAHLLALSDLILAGNTPGFVQDATIDKVSITLTPPPVQTQFRWWLSTTPYGLQLGALLSVYAVGGMYVGGLPETAAFRRAGGVFI